MCVALLRRLLNARNPAAKEQWPKRSCSWDNKNAKSPGAVFSMRIDFFDAYQGERNGKNKSATQIGSKAEKE